MIIIKRIVIFASAFVLSMCLFLIPACAAGSWSVPYFREVFPHAAVVITSSGQQILLGSKDPVNSSSTTLTIREVDYGDSRYNGGDNFSWWPNGIFEYTVSYTNRNFTFDTSMKIIVLQGTFNITFTGAQIYPSIDDYLNPPADPTWFDIMWDTFTDYLGNPVPFEWIKNLYDRLWGDPEDDISIIDKVEIDNPTLAPTPTPIPYQTVVVPQIDPVTGDTYYTYEYHYNNPSGTPIVATAPPPQPTSSAGGGNGGGDYWPIGGEPYSIPSLPWINTTITIGNDDVNILDGFGDGIDSINTIGSQYQDGMNTATESFGFLPPDWLILIGVCSAIILIGGIISRFLS